MNGNLIPERLSWPTIWDTAEEFRKRYVIPTETIPVPIERIIETKMGIEIRPIQGMKGLAGIEALLLNDLRSILIDNGIKRKSWGEERTKHKYLIV